jgi:hypothetical protein
VAEGFAVLLTDYRQQYDEYQLDEVVVGAIAQVVRRIRLGFCCHRFACTNDSPSLT